MHIYVVNVCVCVGMWKKRQSTISDSFHCGVTVTRGFVDLELKIMVRDERRDFFFVVLRNLFTD